MHYPVMLPEVMSALSPKDGETYIDGTFGNGGYSQAILEAADCHLIALDRDPSVLPAAAALKENYGARFSFRQMAFSQMDEAGSQIQGGVDAVILDIGVSSMQIDQAERGFSFMRAGPLDMRMGRAGPSAAEAVGKLSEKDMAQVFKAYGEERHARRAARAIVNAREVAAIKTTDALADIVEKALGRHGKNHPATRIFQALRIFINDELGELYQALCAAERILNPGGRLIVVTFHSLEDRLVKKFLRRRADPAPSVSRYLPENTAPVLAPSFVQPQRQAQLPSDPELSENPRSRSAKLRWAVRTKAAAFDAEESLLPRAPRLSDYRWAA